MPDIQSLHAALGAMSQKERDDFLGAALSQQPAESLESILQKLGLEDLPVNSKVRLVFKMGLSPVAHAFKSGPDRQLQWVVPVVPEHLRPLVYSTSRLINEFQETLACLQNGRGDFVKAFTLLNPENMLEMVNRFGEEMQTYTQQLREANGRFNRNGQQRSRRGSGPRQAPAGVTHQTAPQEQPAPVAATPEEEPGQKPRKTTARPKPKAQPQAAKESAAKSVAVEGTVPGPNSEPEAEPSVSESEPSDIAIAVSSNDEAAPVLTKDELAAFGFDVFSAAVESPQDDSEK